MKIIPLGTNGFFPSFNRQTACYIVRYSEKLIVLDAGSGLFRFAEPVGKKLLDDCGEIDLFLSHYHLDHTFGFYAAFKLFKDKKVSVFGSLKRQVFSEFTKIKYFPVNYSKEHKNFQWRIIGEGRNKVADYQVFSRRQYHRGERSLALRLEFADGKSIAYVTDSEPSKKSVEFVREADVLLHEHQQSNGRKTKDIKLEEMIEDGHVTTEGAAVTAREGKVKKLYLIHHHPFEDERELETELKKARKIFKKSYLAMDLEEIEF